MLSNSEINKVAELTQEWIDYVDIYRSEPYTVDDIMYGLTTSGEEGQLLLDKIFNMKVKEWADAATIILEKVNQVANEVV